MRDEEPAALEDGALVGFFEAVWDGPLQNGFPLSLRID